MSTADSAESPMRIRAVKRAASTAPTIPAVRARLRSVLLTHRRAGLFSLLFVATVGLFSALAPATSAYASASLESTGSSFAGVAIQQWVGQAATLYGLNINWQVSSSVIGLDNFAENEVDFGASDIPYSSDQAQSTPSQPYQYMPDVAGALAFMYNITDKYGQKVTGLVLTPQLVGGIFSGAIDQWDNPEVLQYQSSTVAEELKNLNNENILSVYRVDASGENYLLSNYLLEMDGRTFDQYQSAMADVTEGIPSATWPTAQQGSNITGYPGWSQGTMIGQNGSDNAANYVSAASSNGAITYVETAYAIEHNDPVASVVNQAGNAVQPTSVNDATALEKAILYSDLTQNLSNVFTNPLPNAYPVSSYSYLVTPCSPSLAAVEKPATNCSGPSGTSPFASAKGEVLGQFVAFLACAGQESMAQLGYSPLPPNLVQEDFYAIGRMNGGHEPPPVSAATCKNPYVDGQTPLPGEPAVTDQKAPGSPSQVTSVTGPGGAAGGGSGGPGTGAGSSTGNGAGSGGSSSRSGGSHGSASAGPTAGSGASKYLHKEASRQNGATGSRSDPFKNAADMTAAADGALGAPAEQIAIWCTVFAVAIFLPLLFFGRRRARKRNGGPPTSLSHVES